MWRQQVRPRFRSTPLPLGEYVLVPDRFFQHKLLQPADNFRCRRPCLFQSVYFLVPDRFFQLAD